MQHQRVMSYVPVAEVFAERDRQVVQEFEAEMNRRKRVDANTPNVQFFPGMTYVDKRPIDAEIADGKKQRVFYMRNELYGREAAIQSARAQLLQARPRDSREFPDD